MGGGPLFILDMAACALLAAAAACLGRVRGGHVSGAAVLGCLAGLSLPLLRECLLGMSAYALDSTPHLAAAVFGSLAGLAAARLSMRFRGVFYWLDTFGLALAAPVSAVKGAEAGFGLTGALLLGLLSGLAGSLARDMALGDTARAVEEPLYATAAVLGILPAQALLLYGLCRPWQAALAGAAVIALLRFSRRRSGEIL
ncbi:MAG: TRIC cation channel family protein [Desulfovibrio sp.]|jgi:uncharacterized membrane protein YeiH|nr:TRIC cation channel family protein [Desulfovibrio sp.]